MIYILGLILFHIIFFRKFYFVNPWIYFCGETAAHEFPSSRLLGECLRKNRPIVDKYFYNDFTAHPINASYYPFHRLVSYLGTFLPLDGAYVLYQFGILLHYLFASLVSYHLFGGGMVGYLGAITLPYVGYAMKNNASIAYTVAWTPVILLGCKLNSSIVLGVGIGMALLAGYWPLLIYIIPFSCLVWLFS